MPVLPVTAGLVAAGVLFCLALPPLIRASLSADAQGVPSLTVLIVAMGLAARLALFASEPILEDDYQRYLWDGAVTAAGHNPFAVAPQDARRLGEQSPLAGSRRMRAPGSRASIMPISRRSTHRWRRALSHWHTS